MSKIPRFEAALQSTKSRFQRLNIFKPKEKTAAPADAPLKVPYKQRFVNYVKAVAFDYKDVAIDTVKSMQQSPFKTAFYFVTGATAFNAYRTNPSYHHYKSTLIDVSNEMMMIGGGCRNKTSEYYLDHIHKLENLGMLEHKDFVLFSVVKRNNFNDECDLFEKQCASLNKPNKWNVFNYPNLFLSFLSKIVDIGVFNNWIILSKRLKDCDVNDDEWKGIENNK